MSQVIDISIDLETLAMGPDAVILAIGIADSNGVAFSITPSVAEQVAEGRVIDDNTLHWWLRQDDAARDALIGKLISVAKAREILHDFFREAADEYGDYLVWGNSPGFDCEILGDFIGGKPWRFYQERDVRTAREILDERTQPRVAHSALSDAEAQLEDVRRYRELVAPVAGDATIDNSSLLGLVDRIHTAAGDPLGKMMPGELVEHIREQRKVLFQIREEMRRTGGGISTDTLGSLQAVIIAAGGGE
ncbi:3'-5' exoribonuclease [Halomonas sp. EGI 63088]|uniref:3'-5' exoribonuclease n=1 Tax=Halomonas flagellata TaxID=2920385 RepID=A0ABS9RU37_9GAMM|nr:3'-5' exonuclease [Halomonas flagellata]MCH4563383.1 3'-5' exoribonuclease [Halomonas flagellata]